MVRMRRFGILLIVLILGILTTLGITYRHRILQPQTHPTVTKEEEDRDLKEAKMLLDKGNAVEALGIINRYTWRIEQNAPTGPEWLQLYIKSSTELKDIAELLILYQYYPNAFKNNEKAILVIEDGNILRGKSKEFEAVRDQWKGKETEKEAWFLLDADKLLLDGKRKEAIDLLKSKTFEGKLDTGRLVQLSLLTISENPKQAWDYLSQAYVKDPQNPDIRTYRAKILEAFGKNSLALTEYIAAVQTAPQNLYLKDQLAQFFIRQNNYVEALQVLKQALLPPSLDFIWAETYFWNKVAIPIKFDWTKLPPPQGKMLPYINYLINLGPKEFWNAKAFDQIENSSIFLKTQQSTFWLRLLDALQHGKEQEAFNLLKYNVFRTTSLSPNLERALKRILAYRLNKTFSYDPTASINKTSEIEFEGQKEAAGQKNSFFEEIEVAAAPVKPGEKPKMTEEFKTLLSSPEVFVAAFLSHGWLEAAIQLNTAEKFPPGLPSWLPFLYTQALQATQNNQAALKFATAQEPSPLLNLLISQMLVSEKQTEAAIARLNELVKNQDSMGDQAALILSSVYLAQNNYAKSKEIVQSHPKLAEGVPGKELLARIALLEGNTEEAGRIYNSIQDRSVEAKSYLARKAFEEKNYKKARQLTEEVLQEYPLNTLLQENLKQIMEKEQQ